MKSKAIARLIITFVLLINMFLNLKGINPIPLDENLIYQICSDVATAIMVIWTWWKDAPLTKAGVEGHNYTISLKTDGGDSYAE